MERLSGTGRKDTKQVLNQISDLRSQISDLKKLLQSKINMPVLFFHKRLRRHLPGIIQNTDHIIARCQIGHPDSLLITGK